MNVLWKFIHDFAESISEPLLSDSERRYRRELRERPQLDDDAFYEHFYAPRGVRKEAPVRLRRLYEDIIGERLAGLHPEDNHALIYDDLDFGDVLDRVEREFKVRIPHAQVVKPPLSYRGQSNPDGVIDGTFDSVVRYLHAAASSEEHHCDRLGMTGE